MTSDQISDLFASLVKEMHSSYFMSDQNGSEMNLSAATTLTSMVTDSFSAAAIPMMPGVAELFYSMFLVNVGVLSYDGSRIFTTDQRDSIVSQVEDYFNNQIDFSNGFHYVELHLMFYIAKLLKP